LPGDCSYLLHKFFLARDALNGQAGRMPDLTLEILVGAWIGHTGKFTGLGPVDS
jgi:hypothetical protein